MHTAPKVMVSSTFYDLRQIRVDLGKFIADELGYIPLLSELAAFPVDPDVDTFENCRRRVAEDADIFVLVIGGRYGSIDTTADRSITNLEFLAARRKGIPIYAFIDKSILSILPVWQRNPSADFSGLVDTSRLFEFVDHVRSQERVWSFSFETAHEIIAVLRQQFAYLVQDALRLRMRFNAAELPSYFATLGSKALRIALEKPKGWEYRLFLQAWIDQTERHRSQIKQHRSAFVVSSAENVPLDVALGWIQTRLHELSAFVNTVNRLVNVSCIDAFGPPGVPGNAEDIVWVAAMLGDVLDSLLNWAERIRSARVEGPLGRLCGPLALFVDDLIQQFESVPVDALRRVEDAISAPSIGEPRLVEVTFQLRLSNLDKYFEEIEAIRRQSYS